MLKTRASLPIAGLKNDILQLLKENNVVVVCGETGSGKTTQVFTHMFPLFLSKPYLSEVSLTCIALISCWLIAC